MICDCPTTIAAQISERLREKAGENTVELDCGAFYTNGRMDMDYDYAIPFKVTGTAKGWTKGKVMPVKANFCPFCGQRTRKQEPSA